MQVLPEAAGWQATSARRHTPLPPPQDDPEDLQPLPDYQLKLLTGFYQLLEDLETSWVQEMGEEKTLSLGNEDSSQAVKMHFQRTSLSLKESPQLLGLSHY